MAQIRTLSQPEEQVLEQMRHLNRISREWKLTITMHQRKEGGYLQLEPTPYLKIPVVHDAFVAVE